MGSKSVTESAEERRRLARSRMEKARAAKALRAAELARVGKVEVLTGEPQPASSEGKTRGLALADALKSRAKNRKFAKQQFEEARAVVLDNLPEIVKALSAKSTKSYLTAKFLFDFAELGKISINTGKPDGPSSLRRELKKLGFEDRQRRNRIEKRESEESGDRAVGSSVTKLGE